MRFCMRSSHSTLTTIPRTISDCLRVTVVKHAAGGIYRGPAPIRRVVHDRVLGGKRPVFGALFAAKPVVRQNWVGVLGDGSFGTGDSGHFVSQLTFNERLLRTISVDAIGETSCVQWWSKTIRTG